MDLTFNERELAFRDELRAWFAENPPGEEPEHDEDAHYAWRRDFQRRLADGGWAAVHWPREYGGRGATLTESAIFFEELGRAGAPLPANVLGLLLAIATDSPNRSFQYDIDPRHHLTRAEWLRHVVVPADLETDDAIDFVAAGGEEKNGNARGFANLPAHFQAVGFRHANIENDHVRRTLAEYDERLVTIARGLRRDRLGTIMVRRAVDAQGSFASTRTKAMRQGSVPRLTQA